jgi:hypothetical protein
MKRRATQKGGKNGIHVSASFEAVHDSRKRKITGLWLRGSRYYAQLRVDLGDGRTAPRRVPLNATTLDEAKAELERTRTQRNDGKLPQTGFRPKFGDFAQEYLTGASLAQKKPSTQAIERQAINRWITHLGTVRLDKITAPMIHSYREQRLALKRMARTVNLDVIALRNVLKLAVERGFIERLPEVRQLKQKPAQRRPLMTREQFGALLAATMEETTKTRSFSASTCASLH